MTKVITELLRFSVSVFFFFFNDTATTEIYTLSLHDALPILNLSISGPLTEGIQVRAEISDDNLPITPEGNTEDLRDLDQVRIELFGRRGRALVGDFRVDRPLGAFVPYERKLQGFDLLGRHELGNVEVFGGAPRGSRVVTEFFGREATQGPYEIVDGLRLDQTVIVAGSERVTVDGIDVVEDPIAVRRRIGYLPETNPLYVDMRVDEYLEFCARARGLSGAQLRTRLDYVIAAAGIGHVLKKDIQELSKGFKQRTGLAQALVHDPPVLVLDEPTSGLDPLQIVEIRKLVQELAREKTIIFSTHILSEISSTTDRVIIINGGRIIADGHVSGLTREAVGEQVLEVVLKAPAATVENRLGTIGGISRIVVTPGAEESARASLTVSGDPVSVQRAVGELAASEGWTVLGLVTKAATLEDVFLHLVREEVEHV